MLKVFVSSGKSHRSNKMRKLGVPRHDETETPILLEEKFSVHAADLGERLLLSSLGGEGAHLHTFASPWTNDERAVYQKQR